MIYIGEIRLFCGNFAPSGFAFCDGQLISIAENTALFSLIGTYYGGDGRTTFALPDLRGRAALHQGTGQGLTPRPIGSRGGEASVSLSPAAIPPHAHSLQARNAEPVAANSGTLGKAVTYNSNGSAMVALDSHSVETTPPYPAQPHENRQPFQMVNFIIALNGVFPQRR